MNSFAFFIVLGLSQPAIAVLDQDWSLENCPKGTGVVTDAICCQGENFCTKLSNKDECEDVGDLYCAWVDDECRPLKDSKSDVCCRDKEVMNPCHSVLKGRCPDDFQVKEGCCTDLKYSFLVSDDSKVCCNAPCKGMEDGNCTNLPDKCGPQGRSLAFYNPYATLGFHHPHGTPINRKFGRIIHGTGYGNDKGYGYRRFKPGKRGGYKEEDDFDYSKGFHVGEITMDDFFSLLFEALEKETNVKVYDADFTSDPYLGKRKSGGLFLDHHFPDPERFFDEIYGEEGHYDHFIRPYEGYAKLYPERQVIRTPHYGPYHHLDYSSHYGSPMYSSYPHYESLGQAHQDYEPMGYGYPSYPCYPSYPSYPPHGYKYHGYEPQGHNW